MRKLDLVGRRFTRLLVVASAPSDKHGKAHWLCRCDCGVETVVSSNLLAHSSRPTRSCGCLKIENARAQKTTLRHGQSAGKTRAGSGAWRSWKAMLERCSNPNNDAYARYGGRGVLVCEAWQVFEGFLASMGDRPDGASLDRIDPNGNYEPGNVRWATRTQQNRNKRTIRVTLEVAQEVLARLARGERVVSVARSLGLSSPMVSKLKAGQLYAELPRLATPSPTGRG